MLREISQMQTDRHGVKSPACGIRDRLTEAESGLQAARGWEGCGSSGHGVRSHGHTGARGLASIAQQCDYGSTHGTACLLRG